MRLPSTGKFVADLHDLRSLITEYLSKLRASCLQDVFIYKSKEVLRLPRSTLTTRKGFGEEHVDLPNLWSSYKGQTVDALAVGGDEGRG